jgi:hypothetical protein
MIAIVGRIACPGMAAFEAGRGEDLEVLALVVTLELGDRGCDLERETVIDGLCDRRAAAEAELLGLLGEVDIERSQRSIGGVVVFADELSHRRSDANLYRHPLRAKLGVIREALLREHDAGSFWTWYHREADGDASNPRRIRSVYRVDAIDAGGPAALGPLDRWL